jgi:hypothetical protein
MQSWGEMQKVADGFIELVIEHDETYSEDKKKKRAASLVADVQKPMQLKDGKCDGCRLDAGEGWQ